MAAKLTYFIRKRINRGEWGEPTPVWCVFSNEFLNGETVQGGVMRFMYHNKADADKKLRELQELP